jgi:hypothetical protein
MEVARSTQTTRSFSSTDVAQSRSRTSTPRTTAKWAEAAATARTTVVPEILSSTTSLPLTVALYAVSTPTMATLVPSAILAKMLARLASVTRASVVAASRRRLGLARTEPTARLPTIEPTAKSLRFGKRRNVELCRAYIISPSLPTMGQNIMYRHKSVQIVRNSKMSVRFHRVQVLAIREIV